MGDEQSLALPHLPGLGALRELADQVGAHVRQLAATLVRTFVADRVPSKIIAF